MTKLKIVKFNQSVVEGYTESTKYSLGIPYEVRTGTIELNEYGTLILDGRVFYGVTKFEVKEN